VKVKQSKSCWLVKIAGKNKERINIWINTHIQKGKRQSLERYDGFQKNGFGSGAIDCTPLLNVGRQRAACLFRRPELPIKGKNK
jgi:hypothetical protein